MNPDYRQLIAALLAMFLPQTTSHAQVIRLTESMRAAQQISQALELPDSLASAILKAALPWDGCISHWAGVQDSLEVAPISESELLKALGEIRQEMAMCRQHRTQDMRDLLPESKKVQFDRLTPQDQPNVLHFGIHNRMNCVVCKPE